MIRFVNRLCLNEKTARIFSKNHIKYLIINVGRFIIHVAKIDILEIIQTYIKGIFVDAYKMRFLLTDVIGRFMIRTE